MDQFNAWRNVANTGGFIYLSADSLAFYTKNKKSTDKFKGLKALPKTQRKR